MSKEPRPCHSSSDPKQSSNSDNSQQPKSPAQMSPRPPLLSRAVTGRDLKARAVMEASGRAPRLLLCLLATLVLMSCQSPTRTVTSSPKSEIQREAQNHRPSRLRETVIEVEIIPPTTASQTAPCPVEDDRDGGECEKDRPAPRKERERCPAAVGSLPLPAIIASLVLCAPGPVPDDPPPAKSPQQGTSPQPVTPDDSGRVEVDGIRIKAPPGSGIKYRRHSTDDANGGTETSGSRASSEGPSLETDSADVAQKFNYDNPDLTFDGSSGGGFSIEQVLSGRRASEAIFFVLGAIAVLGGIFVAIGFKQTWYGVALGLGGIALIAIGVTIQQAPWLFVIGLIIILAGLGVLIYALWIKARKTIALDTVTAAIGELPQDRKSAVKSQINDVVKRDPKRKKIVELEVSKSKAGSTTAI